MCAVVVTECAVTITNRIKKPKHSVALLAQLDRASVF